MKFGGATVQSPEVLKRKLAADDGSNLVGFLQSGTGATSRTVQNRMRDVVSVKDFGAVGDGSTNDTAAIQAAVDAVSAAGGGTVYFPPGTYFCSTTVAGKANVNLVGTGWDSVLKGVGVNSGAVRYLDDECKNVHIHDLAFDAASNDDFDSALKMDGTGSATGTGPVNIFRCKFFDSNKATQGDWTITGFIAQGISDLAFENNYLDGCQAKLAGGNNSTTERVVCRGNILFEPPAFGISCVVVDNAILRDVVIADNIVRNPQRGGIFAGQDGGSVIGATTERIAITGNILRTGDRLLADTHKGINFVHADTSRSISIVGNTIYSETSSTFSWGRAIDTSQGIAGFNTIIAHNNIQGHYNADLIACNNETDLLLCGNQALPDAGEFIEIKRSTGLICNNTVNGGGSVGSIVRVEDCSGLIIEGNRFVDLSVVNSSGAIHLESTTGNTLDVLITKNVFKDDVGNCNRAVNMNSAAGTVNVIIDDNDMADIGFTAIRNDGNATKIRRNTGFVSENRGTATIADTTTSVTVSHGLSGAVATSTPAAGQISVVATNNPTNDPGHIWVDTIDGSNFNINCANDPGAGGLTLAWNIDSKP